MLKFATLVLVVVTLVEGDTPTPTHKLLIIEAAIAGDFDRVQVLLNLHNELRGLNSLSGQSSIPVARSREPPVSRQNLLPYSRAERVQGVSSSEHEQPLNQVSFPVLIPANISILGQVLIPGKTPTSDQISGSTPIFLPGSNGLNASIKYNPTASNSRYQTEDTSGDVLDNTQFGNNNPLQYSGPPFNAGEVVKGKPYYTGEPIDSTPTFKKGSHSNPYYPAIGYSPPSPFAGSSSPNAYNPRASYSRYQPEDTSGGFLNDTQFGNNNPFNNSWPPFNTGNVTNMEPPAGRKFDETSPEYYNPYKPAVLNSKFEFSSIVNNNSFNNSWPPVPMQEKIDNVAKD